MGYSTDIEGKLKFKHDITIPEIKLINAISGNLPSDLSDMVNPDGAKSYVQWELTKDMDGLVWDGNEKFYDIVETMNLIIATLRRANPAFALEGELLCQGEELKDRWLLKLNEDGFAYRQDISVDGLIRCPECDHEWELKK